MSDRPDQGGTAPRSALQAPRHSDRACCRCRHYRIQHHRAWCIHPAYRLPLPWLEAIEQGRPCGGDNAPLFEAREET